MPALTNEELDALVARALPLARKIQVLIGDEKREHLPADDPETMLKIAAVMAVARQAGFASHELTDLTKKAEWKVNVERLTDSLVRRLADQVSVQKN